MSMVEAFVLQCTYWAVVDDHDVTRYYDIYREYFLANAYVLAAR